MEKTNEKDARKDLMRMEGKAWQKIVKELTKKGININKEQELNDAIVVWGRIYAEFRGKYPYWSVNRP